MDSIIITWRELLLVLAAVLAVYVAEMLLLLRRGGNPGWRLWQRGAQAHAQTRAVAELRAQIEALRLELAQLKGRVDAPGAQGLHAARATACSPMQGANGNDADTPYGQAIRMARDGRTVAEVASECGISRGEAELIVALYRSSSTH